MLSPHQALAPTVRRTVPSSLALPVLPFRALLTIAVVLGLSLGLAARPAAAQCPPNACETACAALWLGDLNNDNAVDEDDLIQFERCFLQGAIGTGGAYCECADFNFDGLTNDVDVNYLNRIIQMAKQANVKKLPRVTLSELRARKPLSQTNPGIVESRYVEVRVPVAASSVATTDPPTAIQAPTVNAVIPGNEDVRVFAAGWYYLKVARGIETANPTQSVRGIITTVVPLAGLTWISNPTFTTTRGLSLMVDGSFAGSPVATTVPPAVAGYVLDISPAELSVPASAAGFNFSPEYASNVTHLIVFRDSTGPRAVPAVGQRINVPPSVNPDTNCDIAWSVPNSPTVLPPFDAIVDCVTVVRGLDEDSWGCIFGGSLGFRMGPVGGVGFTYAPPHIYRCRNAGTWTRGVDAISTTSDSPFVRNPTCVTQVQGCGELATDGSERDCFEAQTGGGCSDADCCLAVCQVDPSCCSTVWDSNCAAQAQFTCTTCGVNPASCYVAHPTPSCGDDNCCDAVCEIDPSCCVSSWDDSCVHLAIKACLSCGDLATGECLQVHDLPFCSDTECCVAVCNQDPFCCNVSWDLTCVRRAEAVCSGCGAPNSGNCCIVHDTPYCSNATCCATICALDPYCCNVVWDYGCVQLALVWCPSLECACGSGGPCQSQQLTPGCADPFCCQTVCLHDPYCCLVKWDLACVQIANDLCSTNPGCTDPLTGLPVLGSCYIPHMAAGCDQPGCCSQVCAEAGYEYCCETEWDLACVARATEICDQCGDPLAGSCYTEHGTPNCAVEECCDAVCNLDSFCCTETWDGLCATTALSVCESPLTACASSVSRSCYIPNFTPGCRTGSCCTNICSRIDPFCCEVRWDAVCAKEAIYFCPAQFLVTTSANGCLVPHGDAGCANIDCARSVCSVRPQCCSTAWDETCVTIAAAVCVSPGACPTTGDCFTNHTNGGCADSACCTAVCNADPTCCDASWDSSCATLARSMCRTPAGENWPCPCLGSCSEAHDNPGCADASCCNIVCQADPTCCEVVWDTQCANFARIYCCGPIGCGSGCNGPCLIPHETPYCDDPYCCDAVCRADPLCCSYSWDALCVAVAYERCARGCGLETAGNCFTEHDTPSCRDGRCCAQVCAIDPLCCSESWDSSCIELADDPAQASVCKRTVCGASNAGGCCVPHDGQACQDTACCAAVCLQDTYCCEVQWDANCVDLARDTPSCGCSVDCGDACAGSCCRAHANNSCDDADCCKLVCAQDSYCCEVEWDTVCASMARATCIGRDDACPVPPCGSSLLPSCCVPGILPNCNKASCCNAVCNQDPFCCEIQWDTACVQRALLPINTASCGCEADGCGDPSNGSCLQEHTQPYCDDLGCCQTVCAFDPLCCDLAWSENCVAIAEFFCGGGFAPLTDAFGGTTLDGVDTLGVGVKQGRGSMGRQLPQGWVNPRLRAAPRPKLELPVAPTDGSRPTLPAIGPAATPQTNTPPTKKKS